MTDRVLLRDPRGGGRPNVDHYLARLPERRYPMLGRRARYDDAPGLLMHALVIAVAAGGLALYARVMRRLDELDEHMDEVGARVHDLGQLQGLYPDASSESPQTP